MMETKDWVTLAIATWGAVLGTLSFARSTEWWQSRADLKARVTFFGGKAGGGFRVCITNRSARPLNIKSWVVRFGNSHDGRHFVRGSARDEPPVKLLARDDVTITFAGPHPVMVAGGKERIDIELELSDGRRVRLNGWEGPRWYAIAFFWPWHRLVQIMSRLRKARR